MDLLSSVPANFGYVILIYVYSWIMLLYLGLKVGAARKKYDVKYPTMYSDKDNVFNCIQRAHQNTLEVYPQWLVFQTISALVYPVAASILGFIWVTSRFSYAWGYYTGAGSFHKGKVCNISTNNKADIAKLLGDREDSCNISTDPAKRMNGVYGYIGYLGVIGLSIAIALQLLGIF